MGKILVYIIYFSLFLDTASLNQLSKFPTLLSHYSEHQHNKQGLSLFQFIAMHYWGNDGDDNDNDRDMQLPYKKLDVNQLQGFTLPTAKVFLIIPELRHHGKTPYFIKNITWENPALSALFRPPKALA